MSVIAGTATMVWYFNGDVADLRVGLETAQKHADQIAKAMRQGPFKAAEIPLKKGNRKERRRMAAENRRAAHA